MRVACTVAIFAMLAVPAEAQTPAEQLKKLAENGRYQLLEMNDRVLRLDTSSGVFDQCLFNESDRAWKCSPTEDLSRALTRQITDLQKRIEALEAQLAAQKAERERGIVDKITDYVPGLR